MSPANKGVRYPSEALAPQEVEGLLRESARHSPLGLRNQALIALLWRGGLRSAEALAVRRQDCRVAPDGESSLVTILRPKGAGRARGRAKPRVVGLGALAMQLVRPWLALHESRWGADAPLICTGKGARVDPSHFRRAFPTWARRAGITRRVHQHALRHTFAYELALEGVPLIVISKALGHASLTQTEHYVSHLAPAQVVEAMQTRG